MTPPVVVRLSRVLPGPPDVVWRLITNWENQGDWMLEASDFVVTSPHREGVFVEAKATVKIGLISVRDRIRVSAWEPNKHLGISHLGWVKGTASLRLTEIEKQSTWIDWTETLNAPMGWIGYVGLVIFSPLMRRIFRRDLRILESLVRVASGGGGT